MTTRADGTNTSTPSTNGSVFDVVTTPDTTQNADGSVTNPDGSTTYTFDDGSTMTLNVDGTSSSTIATDSGVLTPGVLPGGTTTGTTTPSGWTPTPITPIFPIVIPGTKTPTTPTTPVVPSTEVPSTTTLPALQIPTGLNPGFMAPTPFYQTTSPVQSQYYWGSHDYQAGPKFDAQAYNTVAAAPKTPWGLQEMGDVARPQDIVNYINSPEYQAQYVSAPAVPGKV
jgi:hypothetical protein